MFGVVEITGPAEWLMFVVTFISALGAAVAVINRWIVKPLKDRSEQDKLEGLALVSEVIAAELEPLKAQMARVAYEVQYDSGESLKDKVRDLAGEVNTVKGEVHAILSFIDPKRRDPGPDDMEPGL